MYESLEKHSSNALPNILGRNFRDLGLFHTRNASDKVHFQWFPDLGLLHNLVSKIQDEENWNVDISNEEPANIKFAKENSKAVNQDEEHRPSTTPVCNVRLPSVIIGVFREIKSLGFHASIEENVGQIHREPAREASSGREVDKPIKHGLCS